MRPGRGSLLLLTLAVAVSCLAQDPEFVRAWNAAQRERPRSFGSVARIAPESEPGTKLVIHGRAVMPDGSPARQVTVFAYHTDRTGVYGPPDGPSWRLKGWARTDANGRFEFRTIRPGSYPTGRNPAHVHFTVEAPGLPRRWTNELHFAGDPFLTGRAADEAARVTTRDGVEHVDFVLRIGEAGRF